MIRHKINGQITAPQVRLLAEEGKQIGVFSRDEALDYALGQGADLVLIGERAVPPVAKIINYKKFLYQEAKKETKSRRGQKKSGLKEVRVNSPFAAPHDIERLGGRAGEFLQEGYSVRVAVRFSGRQMAHPEFGHKIIDRFKEMLQNKGGYQKEARFEGKQLVITFTPTR